MASNVNIREPSRQAPKRFISLDFARGIAIFMMLILHIIQNVLNVTVLMADINNQPMLALFVLILAPFFGGLAGFFLLISSAGNMISMYRDLENGKSIRSLVFKQVFGGLLLLAFAMICEGITGYGALAGSFFKNLDDLSGVNTTIPLYRWNVFETIHTIAWCLIFNGMIQGLLSLKGNWKNRRQLIIAYIIMAVSIVALTQPVWLLVAKLVPGFPFGQFPSGHRINLPHIGTESFWEIFRTPFLAVLAGDLEPLFPYLAISFAGSIIGIVLSKPKEEISQNFPRRLFFVGLGMFIAGVIGLIAVFVNIIIQGGAAGFDNAISLYLQFGSHRFYSSDNTLFSFHIPTLAWMAQFMAVNGFSMILISVLLRFIEFRGVSHSFANNTKLIRRYGTIAFSNYNNQWIFFIIWEVVSLMIFRAHYQRPLWFGTFVVMVLTIIVYAFILWLWEKVGYIFSLEWFIRTTTNNVVPIRRERLDTYLHLRAPDPGELDNIKIKREKESWIKFRKWLRKVKLRLQGKAVDNKLKWWQKGQIYAKTSFYNVDWVDLSPTASAASGVSSTDSLPIDEVKQKASVVDSTDTMKDLEQRDSKLALTLSIVGLCSIVFIVSSIFALIIALSARKHEGKNKTNQAALIISGITIGLLLIAIVVLSILKIGLLGIF